MKHIKIFSKPDIQKNIKNIGCGECPTSCQSAAKTEEVVIYQKCENESR